MAAVAIAIKIGGPGTIFWMWVTAFLGMLSKYAECMLAIIFQEKSKTEIYGGPMYFITKGLGKKYHILSILFALFTLIGACGIGGMFQSNQAAAILYNQFNIHLVNLNMMKLKIVCLLVFLF